MAGFELLSDQGFRADGRRASELRKIQCRLDVFGQADGSAYIEQGNTRVLAAVYGPHEVGHVLVQAGLHLFPVAASGEMSDRKIILLQYQKS